MVKGVDAIRSPGASLPHAIGTRVGVREAAPQRQRSFL
jgi:hypothetical protein